MTQNSDFTEPARRDLPVPTGGVHEVIVRAVGGAVDVVAHPGAERVRAEVTAIEGPPLRVTAEGGRLVLDQTGLDRGTSAGGVFDHVRDLVAGRRRRVRLSLSVPPEVTVSVTAAGADVLVGGVAGDVKVRTSSGAVRLSGLAGRASVHTVTGPIDACDLRGEFVGRTVSGATTLEGGAPRSVSLTGVEAPVLLDLRGASCLVTAATVGGDVTVRLPRGAGYDVRAATVSGHAVVDGRTVCDGEAGERSGHVSEGDRAFTAKLRTVSGDMTVLRRTDDGPQDEVRARPEEPA